MNLSENPSESSAEPSLGLTALAIGSCWASSVLASDTGLTIAKGERQ